MIPPRRSPSLPLPLALIAIASLVLASIPGNGPAAVLCGLAICAGLVAALDRRGPAMMAATGIAIGLAPAGLLLAPLMLGLAIRRRVWCALPLVPIPAIAIAAATGGWPRLPPLPGFHLVVAAWPATIVPVAALGAALAAWAAAASASPAGDHALRRIAGIALLGGTLVLPVSGATLLLPLILVFGTHPRASRRPRAANDNPRVRRIVRLAA